MKKERPSDTIVLAHKIALDPTKDQAVYFYRASGVARFTWNWALARWNEESALNREYGCTPTHATMTRAKEGKPSERKEIPIPSVGWLSAELNRIKDIQFPWMDKVASLARERAVVQLGDAWMRFFKARKSGDYTVGRPHFKNRYAAKSFTAGNVTKDFKFDGKKIKLPRIGWVKMREELRFQGRPLRAIVSLVGGRWFVSVPVEIPRPAAPVKTEGEAGVDLGSRKLAVLSNGDVFENPKALKGNLKKLQRLSRDVSRKQKGSSNRKKAAAKLAKLHARISNIRQEALHTATTYITKTFTEIGHEDLNVKGMLSNSRLARTISDIAPFEFRRQLAYKGPMNGCELTAARMWYPSSKICSSCDAVNHALQSEETWTCQSCGTLHDRDKNAADNLRPSRIKAHEAATRAVSACGEKSAGIQRELDTKLVSAKQEFPRSSFGNVEMEVAGSALA